MLKLKMERSSKLVPLNHNEFFIGLLLNSDEIFEKVKNTLSQKGYYEENLDKIRLVLNNGKNTTEEIYKAGGKELVSYAIGLANHVQFHIFSQNNYYNQE